MGLDMCVYARAETLPGSVDFRDHSNNTRIHYWRKHPISRRYELLRSVGGLLSRGAIYRRYGMFPYAVALIQTGHDRLLADVAEHIEETLLNLSLGEFFGLALCQWRHDNKCTWKTSSHCPTGLR